MSLYLEELIEHLILMNFNKFLRKSLLKMYSIIM
jgi:hypothetical protein